MPRLSKDALPDRLKDDSIIEAIFEMRFESEEVEAFVASRLAEWAAGNFQGARTSNTGAADIPAAFRREQPHLKFQPLLETIAEGVESTRRIRSGANVFAYIVLGKYIGWTQLKAELDRAIDAFYERARPTSIVRLGLRYTNALTEKRHHVEGLHSLNVRVNVCGDDIVDEQLNLNYRRSSGAHEVLVRLATPGFWSGKTEGVTLIVDLDVSTTTLTENTAESVKRWLEKAHELEKIEFFSLIPGALRKRLSA